MLHRCTLAPAGLGHSGSERAGYEDGGGLCRGQRSTRQATGELLHPLTTLIDEGFQSAILMQDTKITGRDAYVRRRRDAAAPSKQIDEGFQSMLY